MAATGEFHESIKNSIKNETYIFNHFHSCFSYFL